MTTDPVGLPGLAALALGLLAFVVALIGARARSDPHETGGRRAPRSILGIVLQGIAIAIVGIGPQRIVLDPLGTIALVEAGLVAVLMASAVGLFAWATLTMGRNWSLVARTRDDHALVTSGAFAYVRHPIYVALFLLMLALAIALGHARQLAVAIPLYAVATYLRTVEEERLLRGSFGGAYDAYARRVKRFVPGVF